MNEYYAVATFKSQTVAIAGPFADRTLAEKAATSYADRGWSVNIEVEPVTKKGK